MTHDVIVIGGSYAGMAAALQLLRARRSVLVIDAGLRRNRFADHSHGFLTQDGVDPAEIARQAAIQLAAYPTLDWIEGEAVSATGAKDDFRVSMADGRVFSARRLLFALGVSDELPQVEGLAERWGKSVFHCPYCHGYELDRGAIGVIAAGPNSLHQAQLLAEWGQVRFLTNGRITPDEAALADLARRGVTVDPRPIARLEGVADIRLTDGELLSFAGLFTAPKNRPATAIGDTLGLRLTETPMGLQIETDGRKESSVAGAFAAGDAARAPHSVSFAVADGAFAGFSIHQSLVF